MNIYRKLGVNKRTAKPGDLINAMNAPKMKSTKKRKCKKEDSMDSLIGKAKDKGAKSIKVTKKIKIKFDKAKKYKNVAFSPSKAKKILREGKPTLQGKPITSKQRRWLGWQAGGAPKRAKLKGKKKLPIE